MKNGIQKVCALAVTLSLMTAVLTACGKKVEYNPTANQGMIGNDPIVTPNGGENVGSDTPTVDGSLGGNIGGSSGGSNSGGSYGGSSGGSYSGGSYGGSSGGSYGGSSGGSSGGNTSQNKPKPAPAPTTTTTKPYVFDIKKLLNTAPLNPMTTNDEELDGRIDAILEEIFAGRTMSVYDQVRTIHDYLVQTNRYGFMVSRSTQTSYLSLYDRDVVTRAKTILKNKTGTCIDFAAAFMALTRRIGLNCYMITGDVTNRDGYTSLHGWNVIKIDGIYYVFDSQADFRYSNGGPTKFSNFGIYNPEKFKEDYAKLAEMSFKNFSAI